MRKAQTYPHPFFSTAAHKTRTYESILWKEWKNYPCLRLRPAYLTKADRHPIFRGQPGDGGCLIWSVKILTFVCLRFSCGTLLFRIPTPAQIHKTKKGGWFLSQYFVTQNLEDSCRIRKANFQKGNIGIPNRRFCCKRRIENLQKKLSEKQNKK